MYDTLIQGILGNLILNLLNDNGNMLSTILFVVFVFLPAIVIFITFCYTKKLSIIIAVVALLIVVFGTNYILAHLTIDIILYFVVRRENA